MSTIKKLFQLGLSIIFVISLFSCASNTNGFADSQSLPTKEFEGKNSFGDGYIAHISINDVTKEDQEELFNILITQWLEHYKTDSTKPDVIIKDYKVEKITLIDIDTHKADPSKPITAKVRFSIIPPEQTPNEWRCNSTSADNPWCQIELEFGIYGNEVESQYYWLRIISIAG